MSFTLEAVRWDDLRAVAMRDAMNVETGAMYAQFTAAQPPEAVAAVNEALSIDPSTIVYTVIAVGIAAAAAAAAGVAAAAPAVAPEVLGHCALRPFGDKLEVKKVFTTESARGRGVAIALLANLEDYARGHGVPSLVLQTGPLQLAAIALYTKLGYAPIPTFGSYGAIAGALCYEKTL